MLVQASGCLIQTFHVMSKTMHLEFGIGITRSQSQAAHQHVLFSQEQLQLVVYPLKHRALTRDLTPDKHVLALEIESGSVVKQLNNGL